MGGSGYPPVVSSLRGQPHGLAAHLDRLVEQVERICLLVVLGIGSPGRLEQQIGEVDETIRVARIFWRHGRDDGPDKLDGISIVGAGTGVLPPGEQGVGQVGPPPGQLKLVGTVAGEINCLLGVTDGAIRIGRVAGSLKSAEQRLDQHGERVRADGLII